MTVTFGSRRAKYIDITSEGIEGKRPLSSKEVQQFETFDLIYRSLCALLYNYVPTSGHPGGSISCGRFLTGILFDSLDYDISDPDREDADIISFAAGHKALGLYAMWALRNEIVRIGAPNLLPSDLKKQLRLEDLLGFRRNPMTRTPLFTEFKSKPLDGHPTPATPFLKLSTGASGVGVATSLGLALGAVDYYGSDAPRVHIVEGEGGMTPGRVAESLAAAGTCSLGNVILHVDWNQASIDSNQVCRDGDQPGEYVQWTPMELAYLHDWNVIYVPDGTDFQQVIAAQRKALAMDNHQPTAIIYRTTKGWKYGIEGKASHGAGHKLCAEAFFTAVAPLLEKTKERLPRCEANAQQCQGGQNKVIVEQCFWDALCVVRNTLERDLSLVGELTKRLSNSRERLESQTRKPRESAPRIEAVFEQAQDAYDDIPEAFILKPNTETTLRAELGRVLGFYNQVSKGALFSAAADLLGSTSVNLVAKEFPDGFFHTQFNPKARFLSLGGICEDAMSGILSGLSAYGRHMGVASSYGAFMAPLGHIAARLHAIGNQARQAIVAEPYRPVILICAHAGIKTGEDGPTHADPQALQLLQSNFPQGTMITLTPWDPQEIWTLVSTALTKRPAVLAPFVTRPNEKVLDRKKLNLAHASAAKTGLYLLHAANGKGEGTVILQGSGVTYAFVEETLPLLQRKGIDLNIYYVASAELFDFLPKEEQKRIYPEERAQEAMGITGFTLPTMYRWVRSDQGRSFTLHPFQKGHYLGSGPAKKVLEEAGLDGKGQFEAILTYVKKSKPSMISPFQSSTAKSAFH